MYKCLIRTLAKNLEMRKNYTNFSKYVQTKEIFDKAARKIQAYFREIKVSKEKKNLFEETIVNYINIFFEKMVFF